MNTDENIKYWIELSEYDLETSKVMLNGKRYLYVGFMCHQCIEKALKAYYIYSNKELPPHIHNLLILAKKSNIYKELNDKQKDILDILDPLNIESRYPTFKDKLLKSLSNDRCIKIIEETEEFFEWIKKKL